MATTVTIDGDQKEQLVQLRARLEAETGETVSLAEALETGAKIAQEHIDEYQDVGEI